MDSSSVLLTNVQLAWTNLLSVTGSLGQMTVREIVSTARFGLLTMRPGGEA
jgi:hypothetical protein